MKQDIAEKQVRGRNTEQENILAHFMDEWIIYVLRTYSSKEHPLTNREITQKIYELTGMGLSKNESSADENHMTLSKERTVVRRLSELEMMGRLFNSNSSKNAMAEAFYKVIGGEVKVVDDRPAKYYFEPILGSGEVSMICAAIESNHYLSEKETDYLVKRECAALGYQENEKSSYSDYLNEKQISKLPKKPGASKEELSLPPAKASVTLKKFSKIQYAIRKKLKIKVIPGTYTTFDGKIVFAPKRDTASILNPYAMICQNGQYYIIVTHEGFDNPTHYRIDRLFSVELCKNEDSGKTSGYKKRDAIPLKLEKFFGKNGKFNSEKYTSCYPLMAYYGDKGTKRCEFLCKKEAVTVAIDYFGIGDTVSIEEVDDSEYVRVSVLADYDNVKMFCIQQHLIVRPLEPKELKNQVKEALNKASDEIGKKI